MTNRAPLAVLQHPRVIGVLGGVASGKSIVSATLESLGAVRLDADQLGHLVLEEPDVIRQLVARWGTAILDDTGRLVRARIAERVFAEDAAKELRFLEGVTHPRIAQRIQDRLAQVAPETWCVLDAALLLEAGWDQYCRWLLFVDASPAARRARAVERGWRPGELQQREATQMPVEEKKRRAHHVFQNDTTIDRLREQVVDWWRMVEHQKTD